MITAGRNTGKQPFYNMGTYICDYEADVPNLPTGKSAGSTATVVETGNVYMLNSYHQWVLQPATGSSNSNTSGGDIIYEGGVVTNPNESSSNNDVIYEGGVVTPDIEYDGGKV